MHLHNVREFFTVKHRQTPKSNRVDWFVDTGLSMLLLFLTICVVGVQGEAVAQEVDPGETNPIKPSARLTLFPDQHALLAMPQNPNSQQPPSTYTDWARSSDLQSLELQEAFVPALQDLERARAAAGHILDQQTEQVAVGWYKGVPQTRVNNTIVVDLLTPTGNLDPNATTEITPAFATGEQFPLVPTPNSFKLAVGNLSQRVDEDGIGHDEVAVCYPRGGPVGTPKLTAHVTVLDYTNLTESGVVQTTAQAPVEFNPSISQFVQDRLLLQGASDSILSCATGDVNGDGVDEIILAFLIDTSDLWVGVFTYMNDGNNPPTLEQVGTDVTLNPIENPTIPDFFVPGFWSSVDVVTGDFNADGRLDVGISNVLTSFGPDFQLGSFPGIYVLSSDTSFNLSLESTFSSAEAGFTNPTQFEVTQGTGSYGCRPWDGRRAVSSKQACETMRASLVAGLFKFNPNIGFNFDRRQLAVVYNMPFAQGGGLRALALEISEDLQTLTPLGDAVTLPQQSCPNGVSLCPSSNRFSVSAGGFMGSGNVDNPQWSVVVSNWEATRDGDVDREASGQYHAFWVQSKPVDGTGAGGGLDVVWDAVLLGGEEISGIQNARLPAVAWDREGDSLYLGSPVHIVVNDLLQTDYIIEEPPKHTYWWPPDATNLADGEVMNVSRDDDFFIELSDEESLDYAETSRNVTDWSIGGSVTASAKGSVSVGKSLGIAKTKATASTEVKGKVGYDYNENKDEYEKDYREQTTTFTGSTERDDLLIAQVQLYDIWRYPVSGTPLEDDLNAFWEISFPGREVTAQGGGLSFDWFKPPYENGNILSYPRLTGSAFVPPDCCAEFTFLEDGQEETQAIPFLNDRLLFLDGTGATIQLEFSESSGEGSEKSYHKELSESLDVTVGFKVEAKVFGSGASAETSVTASINNSNSWSEINTTDSNTNNSTGFKLTKPARNPNQAYAFIPTFYLAEDGTTKVAHAVNVLDPGNTFWTETYGTLPDPALKLPRRFSPIGVFMGRTIWVPNESADAKRIRGFDTRYAEPDQAGTFPPVAGAVTDGDHLRLEVDVHNYAVFQGFSGMPIQFEAAQLVGNSEGPRIPITCEAGSILILALNPLEHKTAICVWDTTGFGPAIPGGIQNYRIYVTLDPSNQITELYEGTVGPGQNNEGWALVSVAHPELTFVVPTVTTAVPAGADVRMEEDAIAIEVDGQTETEFARVVADQLTPLRVCVQTNQTQTGYHHLLIYDGHPQEEGQLIADKLIPGISRDEATCVWLSDFRFDEPGERTLFAQVLETRIDGQLGNATDTLRVQVDPVPIVKPIFDRGVAQRVGSAHKKGRLELSGTFPYKGDLDLSQATLVIESVLDETRGAGELLPGVQTSTGQNLTLFAKETRGRTVRFETPKGQFPKVELRLKQRRKTLNATLEIKGATILEPSRCGGNGATRLTTKLLLLDQEHAPIDLTFKDKRWACKKNRQGHVHVLYLPPG
jgi:hypothetical protein